MMFPHMKVYEFIDLPQAIQSSWMTIPHPVSEKDGLKNQGDCTAQMNYIQWNSCSNIAIIVLVIYCK